jgi:hypothetical protein
MNHFNGYHLLLVALILIVGLLLLRAAKTASRVALLHVHRWGTVEEQRLTHLTFKVC